MFLGNKFHPLHLLNQCQFFLPRYLFAGNVVIKSGERQDVGFTVYSGLALRLSSRVSRLTLVRRYQVIRRPTTRRTTEAT